MKGHQPRKRFGQNFLVSPGIIRKIVDAVAPRAGDTVVEIGPGLGALTEPLLDRLEHLHVVEIDRDLIERLRQRFPPERLTIHAGDALEFDFGALSSSGLLKIVGNLPYNISSPLLFHLAEYAAVVSEMHFMLQKEVVDRMVAAPGGGDYGRLSVMLQYRYSMERLFIVPPGSFNPAPKVDSAVVRMIPLKVGVTEGNPHGTGEMKCPAAGTAADPELFARLVKAAFSQRRKMLRNTLKEFGGEALLEAQGFAPTARAETLAVADFVRLANVLAAQQTQTK
ncbi:MAG: 16S rRNA (adenine(1518)-N(6)/adenine(1519)-N(6))-dimethyltransferase RsmA [Gammaproteobacteria bacterium]|nr:16S rRNA (adenine(1518)-N(6)/adenine(1519)-N(6))-dimethyltransferase RsmA [Rhodocyclaceae bacterium]MBU3910564.1 16S rRNA (adenine(1518)-N(6)/adenine(1519)-N(6))-dimethyltransferase RsmA [Gammaproteobacteria bacterium]MBU3988179.1 16S rRNA (adenine(1518)-N(6)/adenine(1519)-N(6))-dimethyltransferase RsmA [Gammaproteobacteria bacterium]MBU4005045.1 16S rRNA (adenine(1518)-N(6)/adenine(1519)-N(6))-dimethyltransferase RsmA [Gammaproteobacteria bacterium]MBU4020638.1 16S rRNA (adenine(1518)-N(6)/